MRECNALRLKGHKNPDPRAQLLKDVGKLLHEWTEKGYHPLIMGDFNSAPGDPDLVNWMDRHGLFDLIDNNNEGTPPRTYSSGTRRLDLILGDGHVLNAVQASGSLKEHDGLISDHTLQWVDLDIQALFGSE